MSTAGLGRLSDARPELSVRPHFFDHTFDHSTCHSTDKSRRCAIEDPSNLGDIDDLTTVNWGIQGTRVKPGNFVCMRLAKRTHNG